MVTGKDNTETHLYHGSLSAVRTPEIKPDARRNTDFGKGFYCTLSRMQAKKWALSKIRKSGTKTACVNEYILDCDFSGLKVKRFDNGPTTEWLDFVVANRSNPNFEHDYDIVIGPVADDDAYASIDLYIAEGNFSDIRKRKLIDTLKPYKLQGQILFHTPAALKKLTFIKSSVILEPERKPLPSILDINKIKTP